MSELQTTAEQREELRALLADWFELVDSSYDLSPEGLSRRDYCRRKLWDALPDLLADAELAAALETAACDLLHFADSFIGADYTMSTDELRERLVRLRAAVATKGDHDD